VITVQDILYKCPIREVRGNLATEVKDFFFDSRAVVPGSLFVAVRGTQADGHAYIGKAIELGAVAIVCEEFPADAPAHVTWVRVEDAAQSLAFLAANYYGNPAEQLILVGVTGTNGKTTTATLLYQLFNELGERSGLLSTVAVRIGEATLPATHTTPDAKQLHLNFRKMADAGCRFCFMEVSSHALVQHRVAGLKFAGAVFTNITHDHLDYHGTFKAYIDAKKLLFDGLPDSAFALVNVDDRNGEVMQQNTRARRLSYALERMADYKGRLIENTFEGLLLDINNQQAWFRLIGSFNAYNLLAVYATAVELGMEPMDVLMELSKIEGVSGRFQTVRDQARGVTAIVDYAHTPDALKNVLETIRDIRTGGGKIITVVGCGGNRDKAKRPVMAEIAARLSDQVVLTSDNPRHEEPGAILDEMLAGVPANGRRKVLTITERREAIAVACRLAQAEDIILVAGKGHEDYQEIKGVKHPFDDRAVLLETFNTLER
jgi:UDP-N-acetylmuramoyl-L-alanyl-D-glutamate--2,6-diaminopimelate ligase